MSFINIIFIEKGKKDITINAKSDTTFSDLIQIYFKRACISKKDKPFKKFMFLDLKKEIKSTSSQKLAELGIKDLSKIEVSLLNEKNMEFYSLLEEKKEKEKMDKIKKKELLEK